MHIVEQYQHSGVDVRICYDDDPTSPREWSNIGTMICWHSRYNLGDEQASHDYDSLDDLVASFDARVILPLYLYEHGGITMNVGGFLDPWDSGQVGYIYVTAETIREEYSCKRISARRLADVERVLRQEVETYDEYLTGRVYGYVVDEDGPDEDSCWGIYGLKYCKEEAENMAEHAAKARRSPDRIYVDAVPIEEALCV